MSPTLGRSSLSSLAKGFFRSTRWVHDGSTKCSTMCQVGAWLVYTVSISGSTQRQVVCMV